MAAPVTTYVTLADVKAHLGLSPSDTNDDAVITSKIMAACRAVDSQCQRRFWRDPVSPDPTYVRYFRPTGDFYAVIDDLIVDGDTIIAFDNDDTGQWATTLLPADYVSYPLNGVGEDGQPGWPMSAFELVNLNYTFRPRGQYQQIKITGRWGWTAVPALVTEATLIVAADLFHFKDVRSGTIGFNDFGPVKVSTAVAAGAATLLMPYKSGTAPYLVN